MHNRKRPDGKIPSFQSPWNGRCIAAEIAAEYTTPVAHGLILAFVSSLLNMYLLRIGNMCTTGLYQMTIGKIFLEAFFKIMFNTTHFKTRHHFTVG